MRLLPRGLNAQLVLILLLLMTLSMTAFTVHGILTQVQQREESMQLQAQVLARNLAATIADDLLERDYTSIELSLLRSAQFPGVAGLQVSDIRGKIIGDVAVENTAPIARYAQPPLSPPTSTSVNILSESGILIVWQPVVLGEHLGWIKIRFRLQAISDEIFSLWWKNAIVGLIILFVASLLLTRLLRRPVADIRAYTEFADKLVKCSGEQANVVSYSMELSKLGTALNTASSRLHDQSNAIKNGLVDITRMAAFVEHSPNFMLSLDCHGNILYINPCGYRHMSELKLNPNSEIFNLLPHPLDEVVAEVLNTEKPKTNLEVEYNNTKMLWTLAPVRGQNMVHAYGEDITERVLAAEKTRNALVEKLSAESANKAKSRFLANMSHELRTPMNAILGYSQLLIEESVEGGYSEIGPDLKKIEVAGKHLLSLINEILDLSKIEAGRMELYLEKLDLDDLLLEVVSTAQPLAKKNNNIIDLQCSGKLGHVTSDATKLKQILLNLISNATKFTSNGHIWIYTSSDQVNGKDWFTIEVQDTGIGMSEDQLARIFDPFSQADSSTNRKYGGTGLGLAITKRFCELLGGNVEVISAIGKGTTFSAHLPADVVDNKDGQDLLYRSGEPRNRIKSAKTKVERRRAVSTILVIDDDADIRNLVKIYLNKEGFKVETAADGMTGLEMARKIKPDAITLDVMMPGVGGWTILKELKDDPVLKSIPVAMLTMIDDKGLAFALGADDYLSKPIDWEEFISSIKKYVRKKKIGPIMLVTHSQPRRDTITDCLEQEGYQLIHVNNSEATQQLDRNDLPAMVVLDLMENDVNYTEFVAEIKSNSRWNSVPVIALVSTESDEENNSHILTIESIRLEKDNMKALLDKLQSLIKSKNSKHNAA
ncbi:MAG: ATP-binding protein [Gammaproteobacteria bacterium]|nr:ATP-binding protein [Gammaproteobacteria bacterium]MDH5803176.1 ATP-binding protein [Gammaproteobacteria bacterium]